VEKGLLRAVGTAVRSGKSISYAEASVLDAADDLIAHGTSTLMVLPDKGFNTDMPKFI
jgi:acyl-coenzyme A thioesterase PaaI-like protein